MLEDVADQGLDRACAVASRYAGESPVGWAIAAARFVVVEVPLPWPSDIAEAVGMPPGLRERIAALQAAGPGAVHFEAVVPGSGAPVVEDRVRVMMFDRPGEEQGGFRRIEAVLDPHMVEGFVGAWSEGLSLESWRAAVIPSADARDLIVCTHGAHDPCCGRFGAVAHQALGGIEHTAGIRIWRGSHTGGHRFSPTLIDLPDGRSWGRLDAVDLATILRRDAAPDSLRRRYRGLGSLATYYERLVEAELFMELGWAWTRRRIRGTLLDGHRFPYPEDPDELDDRAVVRIEADESAWEGTVERGIDRLTRGECGEPPWTSPTYAVVRLRQVA